LDDVGPFADEVKAESTLCFGICAVYVGVAGITIMNLLIGILCDVVASVAQDERESLLTEKVYSTFGQFVGELDTNRDGEISWHEFQQLVQRKDALSALQKVDVDPEAFLDVAQGQFSDTNGALKIGEFMELILDMRGGKQASIKDLMLITKGANQKIRILDDMLDKIEGKLKKITRLRVRRRSWSTTSSINSVIEELR